MSEVTLELVQARQAELAQLIEQLKRGPVVTGSQIIVAEATIGSPTTRRPPR